MLLLLLLVVTGSCGCAPISPPSERATLATAGSEKLELSPAIRGFACQGATGPQATCVPVGAERSAAQMYRQGGWHRLHVRVDNRTAQRAWVLEIYGQVDHVRVVTPTESAGEETGHFINPRQRTLPAVRFALPLQLAPHAATEVTLDAHLVKNERLSTLLMTEPTYRGRYLTFFSLALFALGGMLFLALQSAFIFAWTRDTPYLWYAMYALMSFAVWSGHVDLMALLVNDGELRHDMVAAAGTLLVAAVLLFTLSFLDLLQDRRLRTVALAVVGVLVLEIPVVFLAGRQITKPVTALLLAAAILFCMFVTTRSLFRGKREARFLVLGWFPPLVIALLAGTAHTGWVQTAVTREMLFGAHTWELLLGAFALADRIRIMQQAKELAESEAERQRSAALTDALTGLENRAAFNLLVDELRHGALKDPEFDATLVVFDVDGLKQINDTQGHQAGDEMLRLLGESAASRLRPGDRIFRLGGDEFVIVIGTGPPAGDAIVQRLDQAVDEVRKAGFSAMGLSAGHCSLSEAQRNVALTFETADTRMYEAKRVHKLASARITSLPAPALKSTRN